MPTKDTTPIKEKIVSMLKERGPSLPIHISRESGTSMLFASAFLSELLSERKVKVSNMKVGGSPLYYLKGQETQLEKFSQYLGDKEKDALELLKEKGILKDDEQEPAIRVALKGMKDFAIPENKQDGLYWRYIGYEDSETQQNESSSQMPQEQPEKKESGEKTPEKQEDKKPEEEFKGEETGPEEKADKEGSESKETSENPEKEEKPAEDIKEKQKEKSKKKEDPDFVKDVRSYLEKNSIKIQEEISTKKREYQAIVKINSQIGDIDFLLTAKDKKRVNLTDIVKAIEEGESKKLYSILLYPNEIQNNAEDYAKKHSRILKIKKMK